ncbi:MAG: transglutaminase domain-containing protein [Methanobrevibacter sp.]|nr:transglutaminase domain-containing protein [Methanobrevibacter sp.]
MTMLCLFFIAIGGVSASDVLDMSNNPDNSNLISDSYDSESVESLGNSYNEELSVGDSSSNPSTDDNSHEVTFEDIENKNTSSKPVSTSLKVTNTKISSGTKLIITLKDNNGKALKGKKIYLNVPSKKRVFTGTTDAKGQVKFSFFNIGSFKSYASFKGDSSFKASKIDFTFKVIKSKTSLTISNTSVPRSTALTVSFKNVKSDYLYSGKKIRFKVPSLNKTFVKYTNSKGQAKLIVNSKKNFSVIISYAGNDNLYSSSTKAYIKPIKCKTTLSYSSTSFKYGEDFVVSLKKVNGDPVNGKKIIVKITNKDESYTLKTNSKGNVIVPIKHLGTLNMKISFSGNDVFVKSSASPTLTVLKGSTYLKGSADSVGKGFDYYITLKNSGGKALANKKVTIIFNGKTFSKTTNSKGQVSMVMNYKLGTYPIEVTYAGNEYYDSSKLSTKVKVVEPSISISKIITAAKDLKVRVEYINILNKEYSVNIDGRKYTMDEFAYLMAGALTNLNSGSKANVKIKDLSNNYNSSGSKISGKLTKAEYLNLAKSVTGFVDSKNRIPNNVQTNLGKMEANLYIYAFTAALDYYGNHKKLPSSVTVKTSIVRGGYSISISQNGKILNYRQIFDSDAFAKYLKTGGKSALNDAIKKKAKELTAGLSSPRAKANAIFEFVRDGIGYSFYTNSLKGATGTFSSKKGNCCDKANLIVAMCRSVGIYARYSHAKNCKFASGLNTGHVWAQVYDPISQTWYTADATSRRNELGNIKNWNTKSYNEPKNYALIPF